MSTNIVWHAQKIATKDHEMLNGHRGLCIWFTGLSGSGKSTLANAVEQSLYQMGVHTYLLDGDNVRHGLNGDLGFSDEDRKENVRRVAHVANLFVDAGVVAITALISPFHADREKARKIFAPGSFIEVYVECPLEECARRDPKGLYEKAKSGQIRDFTGISSPYEPPGDAEVTVNTATMSIETCVQYILNEVKTRLQI
ncbi:adenylyl-sulfate kinase [Alicyclobacillus fodiniaquatilis]|uniref:Adenylyl-sulfate kinase n=1 Tax=Alicyclobacillus fodiniaquatilis TaxID=1661150 RepID=A0ABW4JJG7_9BACL